MPAVPECRPAPRSLLTNPPALAPARAREHQREVAAVLGIPPEPFSTGLGKRGFYSAEMMKRTRFAARKRRTRADFGLFLADGWD